VGVEALEDFDAAGGAAALSRADLGLLEALRASPSVRWGDVRALKARALRLAFDRFVRDEWRSRSERARALEAFAREEAAWLDAYALFVALHDGEMGGRGWTEWPEPLRERDAAALADARARLSGEVLFHTWLQWQLEEQWHAARRAANDVGVELAGDLPFMVATDSADVWARRGDFRLDARVGVPPDAFSATGQDWGLPVYRWDVMEREGYPWLTERARRMADLYGLYRVDHVVGLYRTYYRPNDGGKPAFIPEAEPAQSERRAGARGLLGGRARHRGGSRDGPRLRPGVAPAHRRAGVPRAPLGAPLEGARPAVPGPARLAGGLRRDDGHPRHRRARGLVGRDAGR
jgi:4-alpha-glucanotransferase